MKNSIVVVAWLALASPAAAADAAEGPFRFRDVAAEMGVADATRGMMAHAAP